MGYAGIEWNEGPRPKMNTGAHSWCLWFFASSFPTILPPNSGAGGAGWLTDHTNLAGWPLMFININCRSVVGSYLLHWLCISHGRFSRGSPWAAGHDRRATRLLGPGPHRSMWGIQPHHATDWFGRLTELNQNVWILQLGRETLWNLIGTCRA